MTTLSSVPQFVPEPHVVVTIMAGTKHANPLPAPPAGRKLERVWTVILVSHPTAPTHGSIPFASV